MFVLRHKTPANAIARKIITGLEFGFTQAPARRFIMKKHNYTAIGTSTRASVTPAKAYRGLTFARTVTRKRHEIISAMAMVAMPHQQSVRLVLAIELSPVMRMELFRLDQAKNDSRQASKPERDDERRMCLDTR